jgi:hypothetical protein
LQVVTGLAGQVAQAWTAWVAAPGAAPAAARVLSSAVGAVPRHAPRFGVRRGTLATGEPTVHLRPDNAAAAAHAEDVVVGLQGQVPGVDEFDVLVPDRDVVTTQNIWGEVSVTRNASLLPGRPANPAFVYAVPDVKAATPAVPLISWTGPFDMAEVPFDPPSAPPGPGSAAGPDGTRPLADWLINFFDTLLNRYAILPGDTLAKIAMRYDLTPADLAPALAGAGGQLTPGALIRPAAVSRNLRVAVDYGFPLATAGAAAPGQQAEIVSRLPVLLCPMFLFDSATDLRPGSGFCASLAEQLTGWAAARGLPPGTGRWVFDVSLYTTLPGAATEPQAQAPPLLELADVRLDRRLVQPSPPTQQEVP